METTNKTTDVRKDQYVSPGKALVNERRQLVSWDRAKLCLEHAEENTKSYGHINCINEGISKAKEYAQGNPVLEKYIQAESKRIEEVYKTRTLSEERSRRIRYVIKDTKSTGKVDDKALSDAKEIYKEIGKELSEEFESALINLPKRMGRKTIENLLKDAEPEISKGTRSFDKLKAPLIKNLLDAIGDPKYCQEINNQLEKLRTIWEDVGMSNYHKKYTDEFILDRINEAVCLVKKYHAVPLEINPVECISEEDRIRSNIRWITNYGKNLKQYIPESLIKIVSNIPEGNLEDAKNSLLQIAESYNGKNKEIRDYCLKKVSFLDKPNKNNNLPAQKKGFLSGLVALNGGNK